MCRTARPSICAPGFSGERVAIDRNEDGVLDGDE
jgi:hypothetical protein